MKILTEHYNHMKTEIAKIGAVKIAAHRKFIINEGKAQDIEKRLRFDLSYFAKLTPYICENIYPYADDSHVNTALKRIVAEITT